MKILLTTAPDLHGVYRELVAAPPAGAEFGWTPAPVSGAPALKRDTARRLLAALRLPHLRFPPRAGQADLVHSCQHLLLSRRPWVVDIEHGQPFVGTTFSRLESAMTRRIVLRVLGSASCRAILPWTRTAAEAFVAAVDPPSRVIDKIRVLSPAVRAQPPIERASDRPDCHLLFVANRPTYNALLKGGRELVRAFVQLRASGADVTLTMAGPLPPVLEAAARTAGAVTPGLTPRERLSEMYAAADVFVMPTLSDTFGMVFLEAMSYGLPVVALDRPFTRDVITHGQTGLLLPMAERAVRWCLPDGRFTMSGELFVRRVIDTEPDESAVRLLADALGQLVNDRVLRRRLGDAARQETALGRFSIARRNEHLSAVYRAAVQ